MINRLKLLGGIKATFPNYIRQGLVIYPLIISFGSLLLLRATREDSLPFWDISLMAVIPLFIIITCVFCLLPSIVVLVVVSCIYLSTPDPKEIQRTGGLIKTIFGLIVISSILLLITVRFF